MKEVTSLELKQKRDKVSLYPFITYLLTAFCFFVLCILSNKYPFGEYTTVMSDLEVQYAPFLYLQKYHLLGLDFSSVEAFIGSLTYSFNLGVGKNIMGTFGYYLSSPFNLLVFLFKSTQVNEFVLLLMGLKLSFAGAFMCLLIQERAVNKHSMMPIVFGVMYAYTSYTMVFMLNIMWLDGYALLPLLMYFIERYLKNGKIAGIACTLLWMFFANYYIAYMAGVFSFIYLIVRMILTERFAGRKAAFKTIGVFVMTAVLAALCVSVSLIPVGFDTINNSDPINTPTGSGYVQFRTIELLDQFFLGYEGEFGKILIGNLPFVFISNAVNLLILVFFISKVYDRRHKRIYGVCFALVFLSLMITVLDISWQAFDAPNWFWHRETFVFMPFFILTAYNAYEKIKEVSNKEILVSGGILLAVLFVAQSFGAMSDRQKGFLANLILILALSAIFCMLKIEKWPDQLRNMPVLLPFILSIILICETAFITAIFSGGVATLSVTSGYADEYIDSLAAFEECVDGAGIIDNGFRCDMEYLGTSEKAAVEEAGLNYSNARGISLFNSNSNKSLHRFMKQLGYTTNYNYFTSKHSFNAPDTDAFFSIGSVFSRREYILADYIAEDSFDTGLRLYVNKRVLPLAFPVSSEAFDLDFYSLETSINNKNYFDLRNTWYASMFPNSFNEDFYTEPARVVVPELINTMIINTNDYMDYNNGKESTVLSNRSSESVFDPDVLGLEVTEDYEDSLTTLYRINKAVPMIINYSIRAEGGKELYINISSARCLNECSIYVNGEFLNGWSERSFYSTVTRIGAFEDGEKVQISIIADTDKFQYESINFAYMDYEKFTEQFDRIDKTTVTLNKVSDGYVTMSTDINEGDIILTTIPYERGWTLYVDGVKQPIKVYQQAFIGIDCGSGHHEIKLVFEAPGLRLGAIASVGGLVGFAAWGIIAKIKKSKNNKKTMVQTDNQSNGGNEG